MADTTAQLEDSSVPGVLPQACVSGRTRGSRCGAHVCACGALHRYGQTGCTFGEAAVALRLGPPASQGTCSLACGVCCPGRRDKLFQMGL